MRKKFVILLHDDCEVMGSGIGNVADLQYLPALFLMNTAEELGIKLTFVVDVAHQLALDKYKHRHPNLRIQKRLWDETVCMMKERGFDVQLHLHPQWLRVEYKDGLFYLDKKSNIGCYELADQRQLISQSIAYLNSLLKSICPDYSVIAFKAGSWGLQPSNPLLTELARAGIRIILGVRDGMKIPSVSIDYTDLDEKYLPYYPCMTDVSKLAKENNKLVIIPLQLHRADILSTIHLFFHVLTCRLRYFDPLMFYHLRPIPSEIRRLDVVEKNNRFRVSLHPYHTHLKIANLPFSYMRKSFDAVITRMRRYDLERIPILIECHSKILRNHYSHVKKFLWYVAENYEDEVEFGDMTSFLKEIDEGRVFVRTGKK